jgi:hypothetical protein
MMIGFVVHVADLEQGNSASANNIEATQNHIRQGEVKLKYALW